MIPSQSLQAMDLLVHREFDSTRPARADLLLAQTRGIEARSAAKQLLDYQPGKVPDPLLRSAAMCMSGLGAGVLRLYCGDFCSHCLRIPGQSEFIEHALASAFTPGEVFGVPEGDYHRFLEGFSTSQLEALKAVFGWIGCAHPDEWDQEVLTVIAALSQAIESRR